MYDLLEDNRFIPVGHDGEPYHLADELPPELVYAGFSFGVLPAQKLAQTRPGAHGALLFYSCLPVSGGWPDGIAVQIHVMDDDPIFVGGGDIDAAREIEDAELFLYPGDQLYCRRQLAPFVRRECDRSTNHPSA